MRINTIIRTIQSNTEINTLIPVLVIFFASINLKDKNEPTSTPIKAQTAFNTAIFNISPSL